MWFEIIFFHSIVVWYQQHHYMCIDVSAKVLHPAVFYRRYTHFLNCESNKVMIFAVSFVLQGLSLLKRKEDLVFPLKTCWFSGDDILVADKLILFISKNVHYQERQVNHRLLQAVHKALHVHFPQRCAKQICPSIQYTRTNIQTHLIRLTACLILIRTVQTFLQSCLWNIRSRKNKYSHVEFGKMPHMYINCFLHWKQPDCVVQAHTCVEN